jgi:hypothetical protein
MESVIVEPLQTGWAVKATGLANDLVFASGRAAERCGRQLAECFARAGREAELQLRLRGGARAVRFLCLPPLEHETRPLLISVPPLGRDPVRRAGGGSLSAEPRQAMA